MGLTPQQGRSGRTYDWDGETYVSVTTILNVLNKPALPRWAAKAVAEFVARENYTIQDLFERGQRAAAIDLMKGAPWRERDAAADLGSAVHHAIEAIQGGDTAKLSELMDTFAIGRQIGHFADWVERFKPEILVSEGTVFNRTYDYAGTLDLIVRIDGLTYFVDIKSGKGVYPEYAMQIAAYAQGEFIGHEDGIEEPLPIIDKGAVLHIRPEGCHFIPVAIGKEVFDSFLYARELFRWEDVISQRVILPEMRSPGDRVTAHVVRPQELGA